LLVDNLNDVASVDAHTYFIAGTPIVTLVSSKLHIAYFRAMCMAAVSC